MSNSEISLAKLKIRRSQGEIPREEYWLKIANILARFQELYSLQTSRVEAIGIENNLLTLSYKIYDSNCISMIIDPSDLRMAPMTIICEGNYEEYECELILRVAAISELFCDIGANIGFYTLASATVNPNLRILSFEPNPAVVNILNMNIELNGSKLETKNIEIFPFALGDSESEDNDFFVPLVSGSGAGSLKNLHPEEGNASKFKTRIERLDNLLKNMNVDLIKMDVEGSELRALLGGISSIKKCKPTIFIELLRKWMKPFGSHPQDVINLLQPLGYSCYAIGKNKITKISKIDESTIENNFIFVHKDRTEHLNVLINE